MNKNSTKSQKNQYNNLKKSQELSLSPSKKTLDFILSYSKSIKAISNKDFLISLN